jgi:hypothetical protein
LFLEELTSMKNLKRTVLYSSLSLALFGSIAGGVALRAAQREYYGVCSQLDGVPGLLQRAGFFQSGNCASLPGGSLCSAGSACTVQGKAGKCANTGKPGGSPICTCIANPTPSGSS